MDRCIPVALAICPRRRQGGWRAGVGGLFMAALTMGSARGGTEITIFRLLNADGIPPAGDVLPAINPVGHLFGTALHGHGINGGDGTVFEVIPPAAGQTAYRVAVHYRFQAGPADGYSPSNGITLGGAGLLYGATQFSGATNTLGCGIVFALAAQAGGAWTESVLHQFQQTDPSDGCGPAEQQLVLRGGSLYGTTTGGGGAGKAGTLFRLDRQTASGAWTETILSRFGGRGDGTGPQGALAVDSGGNIFGTTLSGGAFGFGTIWRYSPADNSRGVIYSFKGGSDGAKPSDGVIAYSDGRTANVHLLGTTVNGGGGTACAGGCGTVFEASYETQGGTRDSSYVEGPIHAFTGGGDGATPVGGLSFGPGGIWGATNWGGTSACNGAGCGTLFRLSYPHLTTGFAYAQQYVFPGADAGGDQYPLSGVVPDASGNLFGFTASAIFKFTP